MSEQIKDSSDATFANVPDLGVSAPEVSSSAQSNIEILSRSEDVAEINTGKTVERHNQFDVKFYVTDHSADHADIGNPEQLRQLYADIKRDGVESVRYDWRWSLIEPQAGQVQTAQLERYSKAKQLMDQAGLEEPTVILSSLPKWATELYRTDKEAFMAKFQDYAEQVRDGLIRAGGPVVSRLQILNELNNRVYSPIELADLPQLCNIARQVFASYNPDIKLMATLLATNTTRAVGTPIERYLPLFEGVKDSFDVVAVDYYPGLYHFDAKGAGTIRPSELFKHVVRQTGLLKQVFEQISGWDQEYELGEVGMSSNKVWGKERGQRYFYDAFFRAYKHMLLDFRQAGRKLPSRVGFYQGVDEMPRNRIDKALSRTPFGKLGHRTVEGGRKLLLQAGSADAPQEADAENPSRLNRIIHYLRAPMDKG